MIRSLGIQKIIVLVLLVLMLAVIYFYGVVALGPKNQFVERELRLNKSEFSELTQNMEKLVFDLAYFDQHKIQFKSLEDLGFFNSQDRLNMRSRFNEMQKESRLISAQYSVSPLTIEKNKKAAEAGYKILKTTIDFNLEAIEDADIYKFIYLLNYGFGGHISIAELSIKRDKVVTPTLLQKIGDGEDVAVMSAVLKVNLRTMVEIPSDSVTEENEGSAY
jgi:hypothetical protein